MTEQTQTIAGVERALDVLSLFAEPGSAELGVTEIAERLDLSKAVVHRILSSFRVKDYVEVDEETRRYRLGNKILTLGLSFLESVDAQDVGRSALHELVALTDETATQSVRAGWQRVYVAQVTPQRDIKMVVQLGAAFPLHAGASSKALLAYLSPELRDAYFAQGRLEKLTSDTLSSRKAVEEELAEIRTRGYAVSLGERQAGAGSVAAPVFDHTGAVVSVISVCGPVQRFSAEVDECARHLLDVTRATSRRLGHRGVA